MVTKGDVANNDFLNDLAELLSKHEACLDVGYDRECGASLSFDIMKLGCKSTGNLITDDVFDQQDIDAEFVGNLVS